MRAKVESAGEGERPAARRRVRSLRGAAAFVDRAGLALVYPADDLALPSLWEAVSGQSEVSWAVRDERGGFVEFTPDFERVWRWKDELPDRRLAIMGKHIRGRAALLSLDSIGALYALTGRPGRPHDFRDVELSELELEVAEAILDGGPLSTADVHELLGRDRKRTNAAIDSLQRKLVLTGAGAQERPQGWPAVVVDILARRFATQLRQLPAPDGARAELATAVLRSAGELSAADLAAIIGGSRRLAAATLERLVGEDVARRHDEDELALWRATRPRAIPGAAKSGAKR